LEKLAALCKLPAVGLVHTIGHYNHAVQAGLLAQLDPPRSSTIAPMQIRLAPFMAIPVCAAITNTAGGIAIDAHGRVLSVHNEPIAGLYAAGAASGGLDGGPHAGYVGGLVKAVFGLRAAEAIARERAAPAHM
jgi:fumarate reductase flavoprotein subunit